MLHYLYPEATIKTSVWHHIWPCLWDLQAPHVLIEPAQISLQRCADPLGLLWPTCLGAT